MRLQRFGEQQAGGEIETQQISAEGQYTVKGTWDESSSFNQNITIVFTEISGYSSIMSQDEKLGQRLIDANKNFHVPLLEEADGKLPALGIASSLL